MDMNNRLKLLRKQKNISQEEAAQCIGVSLSSYQKYERDKSNVTPSIDVILKLADFYGVTTDYLLGREQQLNPLTKLNLNVQVNDEKFIELYSSLPNEVKKIFVDTMSKLSQAAMDSKNPIKKSMTCTCGELEDKKIAEQTEREDAGW